MANMTDTQRLNKLIDDSGIKRKHIAEKLNISPYGLSKKINNETEFKPSEIQTICEILNVKTLKERDKIFFANKVD